MIINEQEILKTLDKTSSPSSEKIHTILAKAKKLQRLSIEETSNLINTTKPELVKEILDAALFVKEEIYGNRIVFFAPLYISNHCLNNCQYCAFRTDNKDIARKALSKEEIEIETLELIKQGHKRVLLVAGEAYPQGQGLDYILNAIDTIYSVNYKNNNIRRINVNIAPLETEEFKILKAKNIGTYQVFQETYHRATYKEVHPHGPKSDYDYRLTAIDRAFEAGIDDVGVGVLYGLADWKFETLAMLQHIEHLETKHGLGPHTISVPRIEPAAGSPLTENPPAPVSDDDFKKIVAILRLAVPYTGLILSTRENPKIRREILNLGISQISAGSKTNPGGYSKSKKKMGEQFSLGDHRPLDEVIFDLLKNGYLPSFCTACYRLGRTGLDFMEYAKPGDIRKKCAPNAIVTFKEFLCDFASPKTKELGEQKIAELLNEHNENPKTKEFIKKSLKSIEDGKRDLFI